jgi:hypothetical protein
VPDENPDPVPGPTLDPARGQDGDVVPHLTIGYEGGVPALRAAGEAVRPHLPIEAAATEITLMAGPASETPDTPPGRWRQLAAFPLRGQTAGTAGESLA